MGVAWETLLTDAGSRGESMKLTDAGAEVRHHRVRIHARSPLPLDP
jgi:hypothetical protein